MQTEHFQIVSDIKSEFEAVRKVYARLKEENDTLVCEKQALVDKVEQLTAGIKELEKRNETLILARAVGNAATGENTEARKRIDELVGEIDKCIALLNRWYDRKAGN